jgi:hypothetical protein
MPEGGGRVPDAGEHQTPGTQATLDDDRPVREGNAHVEERDGVTGVPEADESVDETELLRHPPSELAGRER